MGSGTSGGVLAPLLIMGWRFTLGAMEAHLLPAGDRALWPLVSMAAALAGTMRSPLTAVIFALELTGDIETLPALLIASVFAYGFTVLAMRRSILTEKVARRGHHVSREYAVDPLEIMSVGDVLTSDVVTVPASLPLSDLIAKFLVTAPEKSHQGYPVVDASGRLLGMLTRNDLLNHWLAAYVRRAGGPDGFEFGPIVAYDLIHREPIVAHPWESCRVAAQRMAQYDVGRLLVVSVEQPERLIGIVSRSDLIKNRFRLAEEELKRERFLGRGVTRK